MFKHEKETIVHKNKWVYQMEHYCNDNNKMLIVCGDFVEIRKHNDDNANDNEWINPITIQENKIQKYTRYNPNTNRNDVLSPANSFISYMIHNKQFLYTACFDGYVRIVDIESQYIWKYRGHTTTHENSRIWCVKFLDQNTIVSSGNDGIILGWDERKKQTDPCFKIHSGGNKNENRRIGNILVIDPTKFITSREPIDKYDKKTNVTPPKTFSEKIDIILSSNNNNNNNNINDKNHQNNNQLICYDIRHCL
jgi:WD40 repeat protein